MTFILVGSLENILTLYQQFCILIVISVMTSVESCEQYSDKVDSSRISKVEPREYSSLHILEVFIF